MSDAEQAEVELDVRNPEAAVGFLERALALYEEIGDAERAEVTGARLAEVRGRRGGRRIG